MSLHRLKHMLCNAQNLVAFTGAGVSAESGIPTYRGSSGLWNRFDPEKYANISYFLKEPAYYWQFFQEVRYPSLENALPGKTHEILAQLERNGQLQAVITQNIDGLHQAAGSSRVLELHGSSRSFHCLHCKSRCSLHEAYALLQDSLPPKCTECGSLIRPDTVLFGEALPADVLQEASQAAEQCDLFLALGSSLLVQPAASLPALAKRNKSNLIIINKDETPLDSEADLVLHASAGQTLSQALGDLP